MTGPAGHGHLVLGRDVVEGRRRDGTPNVSHAWARTVDGAQGGTWEQVHLLGTTALDRYTGYVGQSRGRAATHTWNVRPLAAVDHGGRLADERDPAETVLAALERQPDGTFATHDDPHAVDRELRAERDTHVAVIATRPPDVSRALADASRRLAVARDDRRQADHALAAATRDRAAVGPVARLRRDGRARAARAERTSAAATARRDDAAARIASTQREVDRLEHADDARRTWNNKHGWRLARVTEIDDRLAHHWADVVLAATRQGDPLGYGADRLRHAYRTTVDDLRAIERQIPPDRGGVLRRAEADLAHQRRQHDYARQRHAAARADTDRLMRRPHRRSRAAGDTLARLQIAEGDVRRAREEVALTTARVEDERAHAAARRAALAETNEVRRSLGAAARELGSALDTTRAARVRDAAIGDPTSEDLQLALGPPPDTVAGRTAWCGLAYRIEAYRDRYCVDGVTVARDAAARFLGPRPFASDGRRAWDSVNAMLHDAPRIIADADRHERRCDVNEPDSPATWAHAVDRSLRHVTLGRREVGLEVDL